MNIPGWIKNGWLKDFVLGLIKDEVKLLAQKEAGALLAKHGVGLPVGPGYVPGEGEIVLREEPRR